MSHTSSSFNWDDFHVQAIVEDLAENQRWSTWDDVEPLQRGPAPWPAWVVTSAAAIDTDLGVLKTGKEADVSLLQRAVPGDPAQACLLAAKRYRGADHRLFHRDATYTEGRRVRNSRDMRAMARGTLFGRQVEADLWAAAEWSALKVLFRAGVPVPYPVQLDGREILMEFIAEGDAAAPRLHQLRPSPDELADLWAQLHAALCRMAQLGVVHGDLSPYNILVRGSGGQAPEVVIIDVPQLVDLAANMNAVEFLHRDCTNLARWFTARGHEVDADDLLVDVLAHAW